MHPEDAAVKGVLQAKTAATTKLQQIFSNEDEKTQEILQNLNEQTIPFGSKPSRAMSTSSSLQKDEKNISSCSTLDVDKRAEDLILTDYQKQIKDLQCKLMKNEKDRDELKSRLEEITKEKDRCKHRLEIISAANESRITEMHCVIAELTKKLRIKEENTILEENEQEGSELNFQEGSTYNSELNLTNPEVECQTEPLEVDFSNLYDEFKEEFKDEIFTKTQIETLQEEVFHLKAQIALLESQIACSQIKNSNAAVEQENNFENSGNLDCPHTLNDSVQDKFIYFYDDKCKTDDHGKRYTKDIFENSNEKTVVLMNTSAIKQSTTRNLNYQNSIISEENYHYHIKSSTAGVSVPKMAERIKLSRTCEEHHVTGNEILNTGLNKIELVEHLVSNLLQNDMFENFTEPSQLYIEFHRLQRRIDHLKIRNSVLSLTLDEVKEHCDHLYLLSGKYESNAIALQCALNCSDRAIEAYDVMLALLESKLAIIIENSNSAEESRNAVESVARHLLDRLENENNISDNSLGPWQKTFCISESQHDVPWTSNDDCRLRHHVSKLKGQRSAMQNTTVNLESPFSTHYEKVRKTFEDIKDSKVDNTQMDLEMAVLMQELLSLREDVIDAKQKLNESERDKKIALEKVVMLQETLTQLQIQLIDSDALLNLTSRDRSSFSETDHAALIERQLVEALSRESELKKRIQSLIGSVSVTRKYDEKFIQVQNNLTELQKINYNLTHTLEQSKRKYQSKIKRLEQKILELGLLHKNDNVPETTL